jgi:hypothetical protein
MAGVGLGLLVGVAAGLLMAPMRGSQMRASLRSRADNAVSRATALLEEGRRAFRTSSAEPALQRPEGPPTATLTATLGEIAQMHGGVPLSEARS